MLLLPGTAKARSKLGVALAILALVGIMSNQHSYMTSTAHLRAYTKAGVQCAKLNETEVESWILEQRERLTGYCKRSFPPEYDCVDKVSFLYGCEHVNDMRETGDIMGRLVAILVVGTLLLSCLP
jgi:hypothetical protein